MDKLKDILQGRREELSLKMREVSASTSIDQAVLSKIERGVRLPTDSQLTALSVVYDIDILLLQKYWLAEKIIKEVRAYPEVAIEAMVIAEPRIEYLASPQVLDRLVLSDRILHKLDVVDKLHKQWKSLKPLEGIHLAKIKEYYSVKYTFESNQIEGNTMTLRETEMVINDGVTVSGKTITEHLEAINHGHAIEMLYDLVSGDISYDRRILLDLHSLILRSINQKYAGTYRDVPVMISGSSHTPPQPYMVDKMMEDYFIHFRNHKRSLHPIILAAEMHERLVSIHPFIDGNGRTSRLIMNLILLQHGYTITYLKGDYESRMRYYAALEAVQIDNDPESFYDLVIDAVEDSLRDHLRWVVPS